MKLDAVGEFGHEPAGTGRCAAGVRGHGETGCTLGRDAEERVLEGLPLLSAHLEEGPTLWHHLRGILKRFTQGTRCGRCMRWVCWSCCSGSWH